MLQEFYFYIDSAYRYGDGFPDEASRDAFNQEVTDLFRQAGWDIQKGKLSGECDYALKNDGKQSLYLHPMQISGIVQAESVPEIESLLAQATTFRLRETRGFKQYVEMSDEEYGKYLDSRRGEMEAAILERFKTRRRDRFRTGDHSDYIARPFILHRMETRNRYEEDKATAYVRNLIEEMIADGRLTTAETRYGRGIRTTGAVKAPKKVRQSR